MYYNKQFLCGDPGFQSIYSAIIIEQLYYIWKLIFNAFKYASKVLMNWVCLSPVYCLSIRALAPVNKLGLPWIFFLLY